MTDHLERSGSERTGEEANLVAAAGSDVAAAVEAAGHFRIYLGAAAGVGKTYAMLNEGRRRLARGTDVVIGLVECHGRRRTEEQLQGIEVAQRRVVDYRGTRFEEMDTDAVIARRPKVALVDELAHTNVPGSGRHEKRWQNVLEILEAGIDVITTVNIQHLESIADAVEQMTGARVVNVCRTGWCARPTRSSSSTPRRSRYGEGCSTATSTRPRRCLKPSRTSSARTTSSR